MLWVAILVAVGSGVASGLALKPDSAQAPIGETSTSARNPLTEKFDARVEDVLKHFQVPGLSIAVVLGNETFAKVACVYDLLQSRGLSFVCARAMDLRTRREML